jgi:hypothetical protein
MWRLLRRTLVLQQFYSAIVAVACPQPVEGFRDAIEHNYSKRVYL